MTRVVRFHQIGGTEFLQIEDLEVGAPGPDEIITFQLMCQPALSTTNKIILSSPAPVAFANCSNTKLNHSIFTLGIK